MVIGFYDDPSAINSIQKNKREKIQFLNQHRQF